MFLTNKHVVTALIVAPILAILAWFAVGQFAGEKPQLAQAGKAYPLLEKSNCRYDSGRCDLENEEFKLVVELQGLNLIVRSDHALRGVMIVVDHPGANVMPDKMTEVDGDNMNWRYALAKLPPSDARIRLVAATATHSYFGDAATTFINRQ